MISVIILIKSVIKSLFYSEKKDKKEIAHINTFNKPVYYIIRRETPWSGFFSNYIYILGHIMYAVQKNYFPVVDMLNYKTLYYKSGKKKNDWNNFFCDLNGISLETAYKSKNYILSKMEYLKEFSEYGCKDYAFPTVETKKIQVPIIKKYIKLRNELVNEFDEDWNKMFSFDDVVIGIHIRGTDMKSAKGHPIPRSVDDYFKEIDALNGKFTKLYIATDEDEILQKFINKYKNIAYYQKSFRATIVSTVGIHKQICDRANHNYLLGKEVLKDTYFLSKCSILLCGASNVTNVAILWNDMYANNGNDGRLYSKVIWLSPILWN